MIQISIDGVQINVLEHTVMRTSRGVSTYFEADFPGEKHVRCIGLYDDPYLVEEISINAISQIFEGVYINENLQDPPKEDQSTDGLITIQGVSMEDVAYKLLELSETIVQ